MQNFSCQISFRAAHLKIKNAAVQRWQSTQIRREKSALYNTFCTYNTCAYNILFYFFTEGLTEEDLTNYQIKCNKSRAAVRLERYYTWTDGLEAALCKHQSKRRFHEVALKRCMRSQKQIHKTFPKASRSQRKRAFNKFQNEHRSLRNILSKQKEGVSEFLSYQSPHKIGQDYIEGKLQPV